MGFWRDAVQKRAVAYSSQISNKAKVTEQTPQTVSTEQRFLRSPSTLFLEQGVKNTSTKKVGQLVLLL